jgi:CheY-like chemotaxis protein
VDAHDGRVSARSDGVGCGSTFVVELPALDATRVVLADDMPSAPRSLAAVSGTPVRILVVDDNRDATTILRIALEGRGHLVATAFDGPSALQIAETFAPELALVDIGLPVMDGYELAERLRASSKIPIVAITGYGQQSDRQRTELAGFAAHLVKPVDFTELAALVERLRGHSQT